MITDGKTDVALQSRIGKEMKIHPSMMLQSWMGSDFTNDDIVKESSIIEDYTHALTGKKTLKARNAT